MSMSEGSKFALQRSSIRGGHNRFVYPGWSKRGIQKPITTLCTGTHHHTVYIHPSPHCIQTPITTLYRHPSHYTGTHHIVYRHPSPHCVQTPITTLYTDAHHHTVSSPRKLVGISDDMITAPRCVRFRVAGR